jgi:hypothetical protein
MAAGCDFVDPAGDLELDRLVLDLRTRGAPVGGHHPGADDGAAGDQRRAAGQRAQRHTGGQQQGRQAPRRALHFVRHRVFLFSQQLQVDGVGQRMQHQQLQLQHARRAPGRQHHRDIGLGERAQPLGTGLRQRQHRHLLRLRNVDGRGERFRGATAVHQQQHVTRLPEGLQLLRPGRLGAQCQRRQRRALAFEAPDEDRRCMGGQCRTATAAAQQQLAARGQCPHHRLCRIGNGPGEGLGGLVTEVSAVEEMLLYALFEHEHGSYDTGSRGRVP